MSGSLALAGLGECWQVAAWLLGSLAVPLALAALLWRVLGTRMHRARWVRPNYRNKPIVGVSGLVVIGAFLGVWPLLAWVFLVDAGASNAAQVTEPASAALEPMRTPGQKTVIGSLAALMLVLGFGLLGYRDDTHGSSAPQAEAPARSGLLGHLGQSIRLRRLTTGMQKALGGAVLALVATQLAVWDDLGGIWALLRGALVVALSANLLNLLDRAPGRATKAALVWWLAVVVPVGLFAAVGDIAGGPGLVPEHWVVVSGVAVGAMVGLLRSELAEQHMLGDTGVNPVGALLGMATVAVLSPSSPYVSWAVAGILLALNLASERWSFSQAIDSVAPLRWLDRLGSPYR